MNPIEIEVYSDMVCPWCRIGKKHLEDALSAWDAEGEHPEVRVTYRAFQLNPELGPEGMPFREAMARKAGEAAIDAMTSRVTEAGAQSGVAFRFDRVERMPNTVLAHRIAALAPDEARSRLIGAIFKAYFEDGADIGKLDRLLAIAGAEGLDADRLRERLDAGEGTDAVEADLGLGRQLGVTGVPFFVFGRKYGASGAYPPAELLRVLKRVAEEQAAR